MSSEIIVINDLNANTQPYAYFSLAKGKDVSASEAKTVNWDIAFSKTTIAINSGSSGPGQAGALMVQQPFEAVLEAPKDGYRSDQESAFAIPGGSGNSWYKYDMTVHAIRPIGSVTLLIKTVDGRYAKVQIISYYKGAPEELPTEESSYLTFQYAFADENGNF
ncbi:HmuY family protein [Dyadobacter sp. CY326]|uniref:HmuY family protein n=1 Tax=Dyadobacter sp. CY326 TaxID=2907300 RepID=UPI001F2393E6|nr:HmuY family protein [Dyadobacter sp. CY326]MCE7065414.1 HmuY family protein [Dyadobacter sp. CY326]